MDDRSTSIPRLNIIVTCHPDKRLNPNAPPPTSVGAKMGRQKVIKQARTDGYLAARAVFMSVADLYTLGLTANQEDIVQSQAIRTLRDTSLNVEGGLTLVPDLAWLIGPISIDTTIWWGYGAGVKDDDNAQAMCKAYRDGVSDWLGTSDRKWWNAGPPKQIIDRKTWPHGRLLFTLTPREEA